MSKADELIERTTEYVPFLQKEKIQLSVSLVKRFLCSPTKNGLLPSDADCVKFILLCRARGLNPYEGDAYLLGYESTDGKITTATFSLITAHQAFLKRAEANPNFDGMQSGIIFVRGERFGDQIQALPNATVEEREGDYLGDDEIILGGWAKVYRKDRSIPTYRRAKLLTFSTGKSRWQKDPCGMIVKVAEADSLRSTFPSTIGGLYVEQEFGMSMPTPDAIAEALTSGTPTVAQNDALPSGRQNLRNGRSSEPRVDDATQMNLTDAFRDLGWPQEKVAATCKDFGSRTGLSGLTQAKALELMDHLAEQQAKEQPVGAGDAAE